jgi:hypothetical protein
MGCGLPGRALVAERRNILQGVHQTEPLPTYTPPLVSVSLRTGGGGLRSTVSHPFNQEPTKPKPGPKPKATRLATAPFHFDWGATRPDFKDRMTPSYGTTCLGLPFARKLACRGH